MIASVLFRNELLKTYKRMAFWVTFLSFTAIMSINFGEDFLRARSNPDRTFAVPGAWSSILGDSQATVIFGSIILILLMCSEFSWRTARQNVIDGLSKEQFFSGKLMLLPLIAAVFIAVQVLVGAGLALAGTDWSAATDPVVSWVQWSALAGFALAFLGYGSSALFVSMSIRNAGPAMAVWFFYVAILERLLGSALVAISDRLEAVVQFLPMNLFNDLLAYQQYDPATFARMVQNATERGAPPPVLPSTATLVAGSLGWIALFLGVSFLWFRRRDL